MKSKIFLLVIILLGITIQPAVSRSLNSLSYSSLKDTILALDHTREKSRQAIQKLSQAPSNYNNNQIREYSVFAEYLSYQINQYCDQIRQLYGENKTDNLPCDKFDSGAAKQSVEQQKQLKTSTEQVNELEDEFMASLGNFDEMLLKEEEEISQTSRKKNASGGSAMAGGSKGDEAQHSGSGKRQSERSSRNSSATAQQRSSGAGKGKERKTSSATGNKTSERERRKLDEIDDDIVARQLKEAAEKETDPRLKEKLWEEYYKYKKKNYQSGV